MPRLFYHPAFRFSIGDLSTAIGKWSRIATFGAKSKDGSEMVFDAKSLGQMVANAEARGDKIAICQDHLSAYIAQTGQPAPALGYFTALALVEGGAVVQAWNGEPAATLDDGLYAMLGEITPRGLDPRDGLVNYAFLSPMFSNKATDEAGNGIGFALYDVAATNTPFQAGTEIQFTGGPSPTAKGSPMDEEMSKRFGFEPDDDDKKKEEKMSKFWADHDAKMAKMAAAESAAGAAVMAGDDKADEKMSAKMSVLEASNKALMSRLDAVDARETARKAAEDALKNAEIEQFADAAVAGGYPKDARESLVKFARADLTAARLLAAPHVKNAPAHLFGRLSQSGGPIGAPIEDGAPRGKEGPRPVKMDRTPLGTVIHDEEEFADEIKRVAFSKDPAEIAKVDALLFSAADRAAPWARLLAAEKVVKVERPEMAEHAARTAAGLQ